MLPGAAHASPTIAPSLPSSLTLAIEYLPIATLAPLARKLRIHKKTDIAALAEAIRLFGFVVPVLIDQVGRIVSGNGRLEAARSLGMIDVPCIRLVHLGLFSDLKHDMRGLSEAAHCTPTCTPISIRPDGPKQERFFTLVERLYSGFARLPRPAPWLEDLRHELISFPDGRHDDQVASISPFLNWAVGRGGWAGKPVAMSRGRSNRGSRPVARRRSDSRSSQTRSATSSPPAPARRLRPTR